MRTHDNTKNVSFLDMREHLKEKGVRNNSFFLNLHDEDLMDIDDVYAVTDPKMQSKIYLECQINFWYFLREVYRIIKGPKKVRFDLNEGNLGMCFLVLQSFNIMVLIPRQIGKTETATALFSWMFWLSERNAKILLTANKLPLSKENLNKITTISETIPQYLLFLDTPDTSKGATRTENRKDVRNKEMLVYRHLSNTATVVSAGTSEYGASQAARGYTTEKQYFDEIANTKYIDSVLESSGPAFGSIAMALEDTSAIATRVALTTPGYLNTPHGKFMYDVYTNLLRFDITFLDMSRSTILKLIPKTTFDFILIEYSYIELGLGQEYFDKQCALLGYRQEAIDREVLNIWKDGSRDHPLGQERVEKISKASKKPVRTQIVDDMFLIKFYRKNLDVNGTYIAAVDSSSNLQQDYSTIVMTDILNGEVVMTSRTNIYSVNKFSALIERLMYAFPKSVWLIEYPPTNTIDHILDSDNGTLAPRLYSMEKEKLRSMGKPIPPDVKYGVHPDKKLRDILFNILLTEAVDDYGNLINDKDIITEISTLIRTRKGKVEAAPGYHDDMVISYLYTIWFLMEAKGKEYYIDDPTKILIPEDAIDEVLKSREKVNIYAKHGSGGILNKPQTSNHSIFDKNNYYTGFIDHAFEQIKNRKNKPNIEIPHSEKERHRKMIEESDNVLLKQQAAQQVIPESTKRKSVMEVFHNTPNRYRNW